MSALILPVKTMYFDQIRKGLKVEEYRLLTAFWIKRIVDGRGLRHRRERRAIGVG